ALGRGDQGVRGDQARHHRHRAGAHRVREDAGGGVQVPTDGGVPRRPAQGPDRQDPEEGALVVSVMTVELRDGSRVVIRPIEPDLDYLTCVDHHDHEALVAVDAETGEGVGVARYVRTGPDVAEPAIVVVDDWQGRGAGSRLLDALVERAREEGIRRFQAPVLAYNAEAIHVLEALGQTTRKQQG